METQRPHSVKTHWLEVLWDLTTVYAFALFAGVAAGVAFGWPVGVVVGVSVAALFWAVGRAMHAVHRRSLQTKVPQRTFSKPD